MTDGFSRRSFLAGTSALACGSLVAAPLTSGQERNAAANWWVWRGPNGNATTQETISTSLKKDKMKWATPVPGRGHSSPTVTSNRIYLTTADRQAQTQSVVAFDRKSGKLLWNEVVHRGGLNHKNHPKNTEASSTVAFDGERLFVLFHNDDAIHLTCLNQEGQQIYQKNLGRYLPMQFEYGYAASPTIYEDLVIAAASYERDGYLAAYDRKTGAEVWRTPRPNRYSFSSPIVGNTGGRDQILLSGGNMLAGYDPKSGRQLWTAEATTSATCGTAVWNDEFVFARGGYPKPETACVATDGSGRVVWTNPQKCYEQSLLYSDGYVYAVTDDAIAYCWKATDGSTMWRGRLRGKFSSSPTLAKDMIHIFNEEGEHFAFPATPDRFDLQAEEKIASDVFPSPSIVDRTMYLRVGNRQADGTRLEFLAALT